MDFKAIVRRCRSYRRFYQDEPVGAGVLKNLVDMARLTASARNAQPLRYVAVRTPQMCADLFPHLAWAGYLTDWDGPLEGERPAAYIVMCNDVSISQESRQDQGIAAQTMLLGAVDAGLGGCMIGAFKKKEVAKLLELSEGIDPVLIIALGVPKETVIITEVGEDGDIRYYRDEKGVHYLPKRSLDEIMTLK